MTQKKLDNVYARVDADIQEGIAFAESSPFPTEDDLLEDVYFVGAKS
jgi:TPP-dependent pyruvate/acetoin dehydrogenase alpha subunit